MKFWAQIRLNEGETPQAILVAFFKEFRPGNAIRIDGKNVSIEVDFDGQSPPTEIPQAIGSYANIDFGCGELSANFGQVEKAESLSAGQEEGLPAPLSGSQEEGTPAPLSAGQEEGPPAPLSGSQEEGIPAPPSDGQEEEHSASHSGEGGKRVRKAPNQIFEIDKIAEECSSYKEFAGAVAKWLELRGKREVHFVDLVEVAATVETVKWMPIEKEMIKKGYNNPIAARQQTSKLVSEKLDNNGINCSFIALIKYVAKFRNFNFQNGISQRVKKILTEMGLEEQSTANQEQILKIAVLAVKTDNSENNMEDIYRVIAGCGKEDEIDIMRMTFSMFVRKFYRSKGVETLKVREFIIRLKKAIATGESVL